MRRESKIIERREGERKRVSNFLCFFMHNMLVVIHIYIIKSFLSHLLHPLWLYFILWCDFFCFVLDERKIIKRERESERERESSMFFHAWHVGCYYQKLFLLYIVLSFALCYSPLRFLVCFWTRDHPKQNMNYRFLNLFCMI